MQSDGLVARVFLVRHGETVDNIAGLYAGSRDSALTNHGVLQATRLGRHLADAGMQLDYAFSSNLSRAVKTAQIVIDAQTLPKGQRCQLVQCTQLREQDFGTLEGKSFSAKETGSSKSAAQRFRDAHKHDEGFVETETHEAMAKRADDFLDEHLLPLMEPLAQTVTVLIVSHGMLLSSLWKRILSRLRPGSIRFSPDMTAEQKPASLEHLGGWSNTGFLQLTFQLDRSRSKKTAEPLDSKTDADASTHKPDETEPREADTSATILLDKAPAATDRRDLWSSLDLTIWKINCRDHVKGLKRTRGGVGSSKFDEGQQSIQSFFKKRRTE